MDLEPASEHVDDARDFTQANDFLIRDIADVDFAREGEHMMLAKGVALDVLHDHHAVGVRWEECAVHHFLEIEVVTRGEKRHGVRTALGGFLESWPGGVFADFFEEGGEEGMHGEAV